MVSQPNVCAGTHVQGDLGLLQMMLGKKKIAYAELGNIEDLEQAVKISKFRFVLLSSGGVH